jgi:hypothetical protein
MSKPQGQDITGMILVSYVFNSPMLIPWGVVKDIPDQDLSETILLWGEARRQGYRFTENELVAETSNPRQKMAIRRILRKKEGSGYDSRNRIIGIECYWWQDASLPLMPGIHGAHKVPPSKIPIHQSL